MTQAEAAEIVPPPPTPSEEELSMLPGEGENLAGSINPDGTLSGKLPPDGTETVRSTDDLDPDDRSDSNEV